MPYYNILRKLGPLHLKQNLKYSTIIRKNHSTAHVLGSYINGAANEEVNVLTDSGKKIDAQSSGKLSSSLKIGGPLKAGQCRVFYGISNEFPIVSVVGLGKKDGPSKPLEERDETKESIRTAIAAGCRSVKDLKVSKIVVDSCGDGCSAGEGASLSIFTYQDLKSKKKDIPEIACLDETSSEWTKGLFLAKGQNISRRLMEMPGNVLTPSNFAQEAVDCLENLGVEVNVRTEAWAKERSMNSFLSVSKGSNEPPIFLEINYNGASGKQPLAIVGKGITFDSGGISIKGSNGMDKMRADMGGAACTVGSIFTAAALKMPISVRGFIPLCENMPSGSANKPGDVVVASNGKSIQIDNTDAEGRLILADALHHASAYKPRAIVDMATLTGAMMVALGAGATGAFTNSLPLFNVMHKAGFETGDRVWRMPLFDMYSKQVTGAKLADINNLGKKKSAGGSCTAAAFLQEFVTCDHWMHLDIAGVMENSDEVPYLGSGMSGRPTRTVARFIELMATNKQF